MTDYANPIAVSLKLRPNHVAAVIELLDGGNTVPFIARYRKEMTGTMDEEQIRGVQEQVERLRTLDERRAVILASIEEQGKLTPELNEKISAAVTLTELEDLYQPYKPKRRTRASIAREHGLQGLADLILTFARPKGSAEQAAEAFLTAEVLTVEEALAGARDIVAETISDHAETRGQVRLKALQWGLIKAERLEDAKDERLVFDTYYAFECRVERLKPYQVLALNRGEAEKVLRIGLEMDENDWQGVIVQLFHPDRRSVFYEHFIQAMVDAGERLLLPAIERDVRRTLTEKAEAHAILVFANNLRALLSQPPLTGQVVLGLDPGFRTGCKVAVVDMTGKLLAVDTIYPHEPQKRRKEALESLRQLCVNHGVTLVSIGNGTASRETEQLTADLIQILPGLRYIITNEAGASVYSASPLARAEFPELDVSLRGAVSIARRVQDPLAELVKIDPKSIGVGLYQHDVNQAELARSLSGVVESVVNRVGVDVNTASPALLEHVAGIGPKLAEKIVAHRDARGAFKNRSELKEVSGLGPKAFEQSAGFLRIRNGSEPLDASAIHPESYPTAREVMKRAGIRQGEGLETWKTALESLRKQTPLDDLAAELKTGVPTLMDIFEQLIRPGRDPRVDMPPPILRSDVLKMEDLGVGMILKGTVRNVVDFGAFVDIGVKQDGLLHRSQFGAGQALQVGDVIEVAILKVEPDRGRISLKLAG